MPVSSSNSKQQSVLHNEYLDCDSQTVRAHVSLSHATRQINAQEQVADHAALNSLPVVSAEEQDTLSTWPLYFQKHAACSNMA
jgi:hypothetical protein